MCFQIDILPDDCLLSIFDRIPLSDLLHLDQVCHRWANLLPSACARRRTLVLIGGARRMIDEIDFNILFHNNFKVPFDWDRPYFELPASERNNFLTFPSMMRVASFISGRKKKKFLTKMARLQHGRISGQIVTYLTILFPNVTTLLVIHTHCRENELRILVDLLGFWSLRAMKLWIRTLVIKKRSIIPFIYLHPLRTFLGSIYRQSSLQQLTLDIDDDQYHEYTFPVDWHYFMCFLLHLKVVKLFLRRYDRDNAIWDILNRFDHPDLRHVSLGNMRIISTEMLLKLKFEFTTKVCQLYGHMSFGTVEQLGQLCVQHASMTMLQICWTQNITFTELVSNLARLPQLKHLKLLIQFDQHSKNPFSIDVDRGDERKQISLPQIKILELQIEILSHHDFESLSRLVFPSVEVIILRDAPSNCTTCRPITGDQYDREAAKRCHRLLILSLKNKFAASLVRLYATHCHYRACFDWSHYEKTKYDDLPEIRKQKQTETN